MSDTMISIDLDTITAEEVIAAYKETGLAPGTGVFITTNTECTLGCALGAVAWQQGVDLNHFECDDLPLPDNWLPFALGFDRGFIGGNPEPLPLGVSHQSRYQRGFDIGQAVNQWWREEVENERD
jgi:hypothetical protein